MTVRLIIHKIRDAVESLYGKHEAEAIARMVVCNKLNYNLSQLVVRYDEECEVEGLERMVAELKSGRPVQYVLGEAEFCDMVFEVQEGVLIPRPETEELVYRIVETAPRSVRILDVGTGSGAIAISLANMVEGARVAAVDISKEALAVAQRNAERLGAQVEVVEADALGDMSHLGEFDVIVSNPPYIPQSDIAEMRKNVVDFEPHTALFVPDDDALKFYRSIARNARTMLAEGGVLWFEIYEKFGTEMCEMLYDEGFAQCGVEVDANDKARMVWAKL